MVSKSLQKLLAAFLGLALAKAGVLGLELVDQSPEALLVAEGTDLELQCTSDAPFTFCTWNLPETKCSTTSDSVDEACAADPRITWSKDESKCGIVIPAVARATDVGEYSCTLVSDEDYTAPAEHTVALDIATPAVTHFGADFEGDDPEDAVPVKAGDRVIVECHAVGGYPEPEVTASLGEDPSVIDEENDVLLELSEGTTQRVEQEGGAVDLITYVSFMPTMADCGKYVKCEAIQRGEDGELLFDHGSDLKARKIMVQFAPTPLTEDLGPFPYAPEDEPYASGEPLEVTVNFMANPVPEDNEAIWHFTRGEGDDAQTLVLQAGASHNTKYVALPLETDGHAVTATLQIFELGPEDENVEYSLVVQKPVGGELFENTYSFELIYDVEHVFTTEQTREDYVPEEDDGDKAKQGGISGGTIAAIVIVVIAVVAGLAISGWAKANNKMCFTASPGKPSEEGRKKEQKLKEEDEKKKEEEEKKKQKKAKNGKKGKKGETKEKDLEAGPDVPEQEPLNQQKDEVKVEEESNNEPAAANEDRK